MRLAIVLFVSGFTGLALTRCISIPPKTEKAIALSESLDSDIDASAATPQQKIGMKKKNADVRTIVKDQGETISRQNAKIESLEWYRETFWQIVLAAGGLAVGAVAMWWFKR